MNDRLECKLACNGGPPVRSRPFEPWPYYSEDEISAVAAVLKSGAVNYWTGGLAREFEREFAQMCGAKYAVAVANGTLSLEIALEALGIGHGDEVIVTPRTFVASASSIVRVGARPIFVDIDRDSQNLRADLIRNALTQNTKAILLVHLAGWPCEMKSIMSLAKEKDLKVIEDCAQATGAKFNNQVVGTFGDIGSHSFCQDKIISTGGEGGMLVTSDEGLWSKLWSLKDHGKSYSAVYSAQNGKASHSFRWLHESIGTNARMTEMQAAIGLHQIKRLSRSLERRRKNAERLTSFFSDIPALRVPIPGPEFYHAYYKYYVFVKPERYRPGWSHKNILDAINAEGVPCFAGSCSEVYREKAFLGHSMPEENRLPVAQELGQTALMFQVHPTLSSSDIEDICAATEKVLSVALDQAC